MPEQFAFKYRAFLSYSHVDTRWGRWLHRRLEAFRIDKELVGRRTAAGSIPEHLRPIFKDREEFTPGHTLSDQTISALDASAALVVLCSPASAKSHYVNEEVRLFRSRHPERPVVPVITEGSPGHGELNCFPPAIQFELDSHGGVTAAPSGVLAADVRHKGDGAELALAKIVARLIGISTDVVFRRAQRDRSRRQKNWITGLSAVVICMSGLAAWAEVNRREAVDQRAIAEQTYETLTASVCREIETVTTVLGTTTEPVVLNVVSDLFWKLYFGQLQIIVEQELRQRADGRSRIEAVFVQVGMEIRRELDSRDALPRHALLEKGKALVGMCIESTRERARN